MTPIDLWLLLQGLKTSLDQGATFHQWVMRAGQTFPEHRCQECGMTRAYAQAEGQWLCRMPVSVSLRETLRETLGETGG